MPILKSIPRSLRLIVYTPLLVGAFVLAVGTLFLLWTKYIIHQEKVVYVTTVIPDPPVLIVNKDSFPISVNPSKKEIIENPQIDNYVEEHLSINIDRSRQERFFDRLVAKLSTWSFYQNLASPSSRILVIYPGERKEEVATNFGKILRWNRSQRDEFSNRVTESEPLLADGKFFPGRYVVSTDITPEAVGDLLNERFMSEILNKYDTTVADKVPLKDALTIASLLEREAYDFTDMRYISGVIWNYS